MPTATPDRPPLPAKIRRRVQPILDRLGDGWTTGQPHAGPNHGTVVPLRRDGAVAARLWFNTDGLLTHVKLAHSGHAMRGESAAAIATVIREKTA